MPNKHRVLVVEDDPAWRAALSTMFKELLGSRPQVAVSKSDAEVLLREGSPWDIVSLDLNLVKGQDGKMPGKVDDYLVGQELLEFIEDEKLAHFVVCCTGIASDRKLMAAIPDDAKGLITRTVVTIPYLIESLFPQRSMYVPKAPGGPEGTIPALKQNLEERRDHINVVCGKSVYMRVARNGERLALSYGYSRAKIVFQEKDTGCANGAKWLAFLVQYPLSEFNYPFKPYEVEHQIPPVEPGISSGFERPGLLSKSFGDNTGSDGTESNLGYRVGSPDGGRFRVVDITSKKQKRRTSDQQSKSDLRALIAMRDSLANELGVKPQKGIPKCWQKALGEREEELAAAKEVAQARHDLEAQDVVNERLDMLEKLRSVQKTLNESDSGSKNRNNLIQTNLKRLLAVLQKEHPEVWRLLADRTLCEKCKGRGKLADESTCLKCKGCKGAFRFISDGGYCYDDTRCDHVRWVVEYVDVADIK
jgi:CheY-like chemotaxis protein